MCDGECSEYRDKDHQISGRWTLGEWQFSRCPRSYVTEDVEDWFIAYKMFKNGFLPNKGGWMQQSFKFIQIMSFIDSEITKHQQQMAVKNGGR